MKQPRPKKLMLSMAMMWLISRRGEIIPYEASTVMAVRSPDEADQRKEEARRARRAQIKRQKGKP